MKNKQILFALSVFFIASAKALAQDTAFTQWENMPLNINPALTGDFDGLLRFRAKYRNQWQSILKDNSYRSSAISADYKFHTGSSRKISIGVLGTNDTAGGLVYRIKAIKFSTSITQTLGNPDHKLHSIALGLNVGLTNSSLDLDNAQWPNGMKPTDINEQTNYADISGGLLWQYRSNTHFAFQMGGALHHINRPNISFYETGFSELSHRFNLHGNVEIPLDNKFSIIPSFLFSSQGPSEQLLFGLNGRWYLKSFDQNFVQLGVFGKTTDGVHGKAINIYVFSATVEINSFLLGFSFDRFQQIKSNAYEFSVGYIIEMHGSKDAAAKLCYVPSHTN